MQDKPKIGRRNGSKSAIKTILIAVIAGLGLFALAILAKDSLASWRAYSAAVEQKDFDAGANRFIAGVFDVLLERLETNNALQSAEPAGQPVVAAIAAYRKAISENFDPGLAAIEQRDFTNKQALLQDLKAALAKANDYRRQADEAIKLPRNRRDDDLRKTFIPTITASVNAALKVWYAALHNIAAADARLARLATVKEIGWKMREHAGMERSIIASAIASGATIPAEGAVAIVAYRAQVATLWDQLQNLIADPATDPAVIEARRSAERRYFNEFLTLAGEMRKLGDSGREYPMTAAQWVETTTPQIGTLLEVMRAAARASESIATATMADSFRSLLIEIALMMVSVAAAAGGMWIVSILLSGQKREMHRLADDLEAVVGKVVEAVASSANELEAAARSLTDIAEGTQQLAGTVAASSEEVSVNVQSVASATEEMSASVNEISRQVQESTRIAHMAVKQAEQTDVRIAELSQAASRIGNVLKLITAIAEQTNLLALNATIEAARAGEAGRGFAVVAQEVKALAAQTAKATGDIGTQIAGMQAATEDSVAAIKEISATISRISEIESIIATAIEEQGSATQEMARNVQHAAHGAAQVAGSIGEVNKGAGETGSASSQVLTSSRSLSEESSRLKLQVDQFLTTVRAA